MHSYAKVHDLICLRACDARILLDDGQAFHIVFCKMCTQYQTIQGLPTCCPSLALLQLLGVQPISHLIAQRVLYLLLFVTYFYPQLYH